MESGSDRALWGTAEISYHYRLSKRKTISISVYPDLTVVVKAPNGTSLETIRAFVRRRGAWVSKAWRRFEEYLPKQPPRRYISGETHRYLGRQYRLKVEQGDTESVKCLRGYLWITIKGEVTTEKTKELLNSWYRAHARTVFQERLLACHQKIEKKGVPMPKLRIRRMVSRWGSFSTHGGITLNLLLIVAPKECIDYVILHELCHFKVKHHGPRFWKLLESLIPDFEERRKKLNTYVQ